MFPAGVGSYGILVLVPYFDNDVGMSSTVKLVLPRHLDRNFS